MKKDDPRLDNLAAKIDHEKREIVAARLFEIVAEEIKSKACRAR